MLAGFLLIKELLCSFLTAAFPVLLYLESLMVFCLSRLWFFWKS